MGADKVSGLLDTAKGGVLFVDEAYGLDPAKNADAAAVAMQLLDVAEEWRTELTIVLAGYKDDIEQKLFDFNDGFLRRFNYIITFEDYTQRELAKIFSGLCLKHNWPPERPDVVDVAARRVSRGRGKKGFGNAGTMRTLFETAYRRALDRRRSSEAAAPTQNSLTMVDIIGPPPDRTRVPDLGHAMDELDKMTGLEDVKTTMSRLESLAMTNYQRQLNGDVPLEVKLNRVFLGNPGTGKTTISKLYGRILKALGLLSDGACELKQPSDLMGSHVGDTAKKTSALVKRCAGKVLIIDEAYGLSNSMYGREAIDTLVGLVHGYPGEDIAVVMIGYEKEMQKMFRNGNPGLAGRFDLNYALQFPDFSDRQLADVVKMEASKSGLRLEKVVRQQVVKALAMERSRPGFRNAGNAVALVSRAKERLVSRDPQSKDLTLADFALDKVHGDGLTALDGLYNVDHIIDKLKDLQAIVRLCVQEGKDASQHLENYVFVGNPGTGKTTIANAMAIMLHDVGILSRPSVTRISGLDLQAGYMGQTAAKVIEVMAEAQGGVLFVDEAYSLANLGYATEAVDQLTQSMTEPAHHHKTVVILAGYENDMDAMLTRANPGFKSRFTERLHFPDWEPQSCVEVIQQLCQRDGVELQGGAALVLQKGLEDIKRRPGWANARDCHTLHRLLYKARARRLVSIAEAAPSYTANDAEQATKIIRDQRPGGIAARQSGVQIVPPPLQQLYRRVHILQRWQKRKCKLK